MKTQIATQSQPAKKLTLNKETIRVLTVDPQQPTAQHLVPTALCTLGC